MNDFPWLQKNLQQWHKLISNKQVPHAILLSGCKGLGKFELAKSMANIALCENLPEDGVCNNCSACELFKVGNHTDLSIIQAEKSIIKVDQIRQLSRNVTLSATRNQHRVVIIENAEQMNKSSANALLKTLEEPPNKVVLILTTSEIGKLLPTITSRCIKINLSTPNYEHSKNWLKEITTSSESDISDSLIFANGIPIQAKKILNEEMLIKIYAMLSDLEDLRNNRKSILEVSRNWFSEDKHNLLSFLSFYFLSIQKNELNINISSETNSLKIVYEYQSIKNLDFKLLKFVNNIYNFVKMQKTPLKSELLLEELLISWKNDFNIENQ